MRSTKPPRQRQHDQQRCWGPLRPSSSVDLKTLSRVSKFSSPAFQTKRVPCVFSTLHTLISGSPAPFFVFPTLSSLSTLVSHIKVGVFTNCFFDPGLQSSGGNHMRLDKRLVSLWESKCFRSDSTRPRAKKGKIRLMRKTSLMNGNKTQPKGEGK